MAGPTVLENVSFVAVIATAAVAGGALLFAYLELRSSRISRRQDRALQAVRRWDDIAFADRAKDATVILRTGSWLGHVDNRTTAMILVNFFEALAADDVANRADRYIVHENFGYLALYYRALANEFLLVQREEHSPEMVSKWDAMIERWDRLGWIPAGAPWRPPRRAANGDESQADGTMVLWVLAVMVLAIGVGLLIVAGT